MSIYQEMQAVAKELLGDDEFRQDGIYYVALTPGTGPADNPGAPVETKTLIRDAVARGVEDKYVDGTQVTGTDGQINCGYPQPFTPKISDWVEVGGKRCKILKVSKVPPTGVAVFLTIIYEG